MPHKTSSLFKSLGLVGLLTFLFSPIIQAQIGIGTTTPEGAIDVAGNNSGLLFPRVSLQSMRDVTTVVNPNGGSLAAGTTVFNTNNSTTGRDDVQVGFTPLTELSGTLNLVVRTMLYINKPADAFEHQFNPEISSTPLPVESKA